MKNSLILLSSKLAVEISLHICNLPVEAMWVLSIDSGQSAVLKIGSLSTSKFSVND